MDLTGQDAPCYVPVQAHSGTIINRYDLHNPYSTIQACSIVGNMQIDAWSITEGTLGTAAVRTNYSSCWISSDWLLCRIHQSMSYCNVYCATFIRGLWHCARCWGWLGVVGGVSRVQVRLPYHALPLASLSRIILKNAAKQMLQNVISHTTTMLIHWSLATLSITHYYVYCSSRHSFSYIKLTCLWSSSRSFS